MALLVEIVGVIVLAAGINSLAGRAFSPVSAAAAVAVVTLGVAFWGSVWSEAKSLLDTHNADAKLTREEANTAGGAVFGINEGFMAFADKLIPPNARVFIECAPHQAKCVGQDWLAFRLTPRVFVEHPGQARWAIFYGVDPSVEPFAKGWLVLRFAPGFAVAQAP